MATLRDNQKGNPKSDITSIHALNVEPTTDTNKHNRPTTHARTRTLLVEPQRMHRMPVLYTPCVLCIAPKPTLAYNDASLPSFQEASALSA
jgi:hypothetical protein